MANKKKEVFRPKPMTEGKKAVIQGLLDEYDIQSAEDISGCTQRSAFRHYSDNAGNRDE